MHCGHEYRICWLSRSELDAMNQLHPNHMDCKWGRLSSSKENRGVISRKMKHLSQEGKIHHSHTHLKWWIWSLYLSFLHQTEPIAPLHGAQWWSIQGQYKNKHFSLTLWKCMGASFHSLGNMVINCLCLLNISSFCEAIYESWCSLQRQAFLESLLDKYRREFMWSVLWYTLYVYLLMKFILVFVLIYSTMFQKWCSHLKMAYMWPL